MREEETSCLLPQGEEVMCMVTYEQLFLFVNVVIGIINLVLQITKKK